MRTGTEMVRDLVNCGSVGFTSVGGVLSWTSLEKCVQSACQYGSAANTFAWATRPTEKADRSTASSEPSAGNSRSVQVPPTGSWKVARGAAVTPSVTIDVKSPLPLGEQPIQPTLELRK